MDIILLIPVTLVLIDTFALGFAAGHFIAHRDIERNSGCAGGARSDEDDSSSRASLSSRKPASGAVIDYGW